MSTSYICNNCNLAFELEKGIYSDIGVCKECGTPYKKTKTYSIASRINNNFFLKVFYKIFDKKRLTKDIMFVEYFTYSKPTIGTDNNYLPINKKHQKKIKDFSTCTYCGKEDSIIFDIGTEGCKCPNCKKIINLVMTTYITCIPSEKDMDIISRLDSFEVYNK